MATITVSAYYLFPADCQVILPDGVTFSMLKEHYVKWNEFHYTLDGKVWRSADLAVNAVEGEADYKRPAYVTIYANDPETGEPNYDEPLYDRDSR